ncbi:hypothetical protein [Photorhabdus bodei]|uniref:hypothetical protein n=1 Tax=Photorhabdus bodei TaxID=2029681 RepID=UPI001EFE56CF|nr:hypothetical protein [Photorhabdus bodei]
MSGDVHVRFRERLGGRFPGATRRLVHCQSEAQAREIWQRLEHRFRECGLALHPDKTRIAYCKDVERKGKYEHTCFDFLGYLIFLDIRSDQGGSRTVKETVCL